MDGGGIIMRTDNITTFLDIFASLDRRELC